MRNLLLVKYAISPIVALVLGGFALTNYEFQPWNYILWVSAFFWLFLVVVTSIKRKTNTDNWITYYYSRHKKSPAIPEYLLPVVQKYEKGNPITKDIEIINMSGQFWTNLLPSQKTELKQLVEWLGMNWEDYLEQMKKMIPRDLKLGKTHKPFEQ
jgi:hypothetical protein